MPIVGSAASADCALRRRRAYGEHRELCPTRVCHEAGHRRAEANVWRWSKSPDGINLTKRGDGQRETDDQKSSTSRRPRERREIFGTRPRGLLLKSRKLENRRPRMVLSTPWR